MNRRAKFARAAGLRAVLLLACAGCATAPGRRTTSVIPPASSAPARDDGRLKPDPQQFVGRILAVDLRAKTAIVSLSGYAGLPADPDGLILLARDRDLRPMARLQSTPFLRGQTLGTHILEGEPAVGDEVVLSPPEAPPDAAAPPPASG